MQDYHAEFVEIYNKNITRPGADRLPEFFLRRDAARQRVELRKQKRPHGLKESL
jgi:hypothetical protein